jgi:ABC-type uncharacterized transport system involved in gliding motility auxiliary subunit
MKGENGNARKHTRNGTVIITAVVVAVVLLLNVVIAVLEDRENLRIDLSQEKYYTITGQTEQVLEKLTEDVYIYTLYSSGNIDDMVFQLLKTYEASSPRIHVENIDPALNPSFTQPFDPEGNGITTGSVIVTNSDESNYRVLTVYELYSIEPYMGIPIALQAEQRFTSTINYLMTGEIPSVQLLPGPDEPPPAELSDLITALRGLNYNIAQYDPSTSAYALDPEYDILLVVSPKEDITDDEYQVIKEFLEKGGNAAFLLDYVVLDEATNTNYIIADELENFNSLLMLYDIRINRDYVIGGNNDMILGKPTAHIPVMYSHDTITKDIIDSGKLPVLSDVSSLTLSGSGEHSAVLMETDPNTWAKDFSGAIRIEKEEGDAEGPFTIGALGMMGDSNIAVYGTSSFVTATEMQRSANRDLALNTINSLKKKGDAINIAPKSLIPGFIELQSESQKTLLTAVVLVILPAMVFIFGLVTWLRRKKL